MRLPHCVDCKHHLEIYRGVFVEDAHVCDRSKMIDVVDGKPVYKRCSTERVSPHTLHLPPAEPKDLGTCGIEGRYFEQAEKKS